MREIPGGGQQNEWLDQIEAEFLGMSSGELCARVSYAEVLSVQDTIEAAIECEQKTDSAREKSSLQQPVMEQNTSHHWRRESDGSSVLQPNKANMSRGGSSSRGANKKYRSPPTQPILAPEIIGRSGGQTVNPIATLRTFAVSATATFIFATFILSCGAYFALRGAHDESVSAMCHKAENWKPKKIMNQSAFNIKMSLLYEASAEANEALRSILKLKGEGTYDKNEKNNNDLAQAENRYYIASKNLLIKSRMISGFYDKNTDTIDFDASKLIGGHMELYKRALVYHEIADKYADILDIKSVNEDNRLAYTIVDDEYSSEYRTFGTSAKGDIDELPKRVDTKRRLRP